MAGIPDCLHFRVLLRLVSGVWNRERICIPLLSKTRQQCVTKSDLHFQLYGDSDGDHHVPVWWVRGLCEIRKLESAADHLVDQHSEEFYHGSSIPAADRRTTGKKSVPWSVSRGKGAGIKFRRIEYTASEYPVTKEIFQPKIARCKRSD